MPQPPTFIPVEPLSPAAFAPFGDVIDVNTATTHFTINAGFATRFHDLAHVDVGDAGGRPLISIFRAKPRALPLHCTLMERHPLGSQAFIPLHPGPYLVVVAPAHVDSPLDGLRCFLAAAGQGVNYAKGTWHHPLIALGEEGDFLVVDRGGAAEPRNLDERDIAAAGVFVSLG